MSDKHRIEWNKRYREGNHHKRKDPSKFLTEWEPLLPEGKALDPGCGAGRNALFLASKGYEVDAIDYSEEALKIGRKWAREQSLKLNWIHSDVKTYEFPREIYDVIIISYFHPLDKLEEIKTSLKEGGYFLYEHHISTEEEVDRGPSKTKFRYGPNELLDKFSGFQILFYAEGTEISEDGEKSAIARIVARKTSNFKKDLPPISNP